MEKSSRKKGRFVCVCMLIVMLALVTGCADTSKALQRVIVNFDVPDGSAASRTILPDNFVAPDKYVVTLHPIGDAGTLNNIVSEPSSSNSVVINGVPVGTYSVSAKGYQVKDDVSTLIMEGTSADEFRVTAGGTNTVIISLNAINTGGDTGTVKVELDWTQISKLPPLTNYRNGIGLNIALMVTDPEVTTKWVEVSRKHVDAGTSYVYEESLPTTSGRGIKFKFYDVDSKNVGNTAGYIGDSKEDVVQIYAGQVSVPDHPEYFVFTPETNFTSSKPVYDYKVEYGDDPSTQLIVSWNYPTDPSGNILTDYVELTYNTASAGIDGVGSQKLTITTADAETNGRTSDMQVISGLTAGVEYIFRIVTFSKEGSRSDAVFPNDITSPKVMVTGITLDDSSVPATLTYRTTFQLSASVIPSTATVTDVLWTSSNTNVLSVDSIGKVTAGKPGLASVTATSKDSDLNGDQFTKSTAQLQINLATPQNVRAVQNTSGIAISWDRVPYADSYSVFRSVKENGVWSEYTAISTDVVDIPFRDADVISGRGYKYQVKALGAADGVDVSSPISNESDEVSPVNPTISLTLPTPESVTFAFDGISDGVQVTPSEPLTIAIADGGVPNATSYVWKLNNTEISKKTSVEITTTSAGLNYTFIGGRQNLRLEVVVNGKTYGASLSFRLIDKPVEALTITGPDTITYGAPQTLKAVVTPGDATDTSVRWTSSNPELATVDESTGEVTVLKTGSVIITAQSLSDSTITATKTINCYIPVKSVSINRPERDYVFVNGQNGYNQLQLTATIAGENDNMPSDSSIYWTSLNPAIVRVDSATGLVTPIGAGTTTISVGSNEDNTITDTVEIQTYDMVMYCDGAKYSNEGTYEVGSHWTTKTYVFVPKIVDAMAQEIDYTEKPNFVANFEWKLNSNMIGTAAKLTDDTSTKAGVRWQAATAGSFDLSYVLYADIEKTIPMASIKINVK